MGGRNIKKNRRNMYGTADISFLVCGNTKGSNQDLPINDQYQLWNAPIFKNNRRI